MFIITRYYDKNFATYFGLKLEVSFLLYICKLICTNERIRTLYFMKEVSETSNPFTVCVFMYCMVLVKKICCNNMKYFS